MFKILNSGKMRFSFMQNGTFIPIPPHSTMDSRRDKNKSFTED
jgi:hypothetical protein